MTSKLDFERQRMKNVFEQIACPASRGGVDSGRRALAADLRLQGEIPNVML